MQGRKGGEEVQTWWRELSGSLTLREGETRWGGREGSELEAHLGQSEGEWRLNRKELLTFLKY